MKYQRGQQFLIRTPYDDIPFRIRINEVLSEFNSYTIQQIGAINIWAVDEPTLEQWINNVDGK